MPHTAAVPPQRPGEQPPATVVESASDGEHAHLFFPDVEHTPYGFGLIGEMFADLAVEHPTAVLDYAGSDRSGIAIGFRL